jgi:predicted 2-oxoglutarate/Fe(II)-dependent dioxygenase YbiX
MGGRTILLTFLPSFSDAEGAAVLAGLLAGADRFRAFTTGMLIVSGDPDDRGAKPPDTVTGIRYLFDPDRLAASLFGLASGGKTQATSFLIDARLRILAVAPVRDTSTHAAEVLALFDRVSKPMGAFPARAQAPVLLIPHVFEPKLCQALIEGYEKHGGIESGFMVEHDGKTVQRHNHEHKRRRDWPFEDPILLDSTRNRVRRRIAPEIWRAHQFSATRIERYLVACYEAETGGHFAPHRDNTTRGTAHRRFAVSINLNDEYEGGDLVFPEFGQARFRPPAGGACVFSCAMLHQATPVTAGKRYVFVPFLYDDDAAAVRDANLQFLE